MSIGRALTVFGLLFTSVSQAFTNSNLEYSTYEAFNHDCKKIKVSVHHAENADGTYKGFSFFFIEIAAKFTIEFSFLN